MLLTNFFLVPYMALRAKPPPPDSPPPPSPPPLLGAASSVAGSRALGALGATIGLASVAWLALAGGEEYGGVGERLQHLQALFASDRIWLFFSCDCVLYTFFQGWLIVDEAIPSHNPII